MAASRKRVIKWSRGYIEMIIGSLTTINNSTDEQVRAFCGRSKQEALKNLIAGMQTSLDAELQQKPKDWDKLH